jgi:multidrug efflux pump subunit AcrB
MRRLIVSLLLLTVVFTGDACRSKRRRSATAQVEDDGRLLTSVRMADPRGQIQLVRGFYSVEADAWRWAMKRFAVTLRQMGKPRLKAAFDGANEIGFAVLATTVSLVAVFVPVSFLTGTIGRLFSEFGISVAVAVLISGFVALTLTPMIASQTLRPLHGAKQNKIADALDRFFDWMNRAYERTLHYAVGHVPLVLGIAALLVALIAVLFVFLPRELVPTEDRGIAFGIVIAPEGSTLDYTDHYMRQIESILLPLPERRGLFTATGLGFGGPGQVTNGFIFVNLKPRNERHRTQQEIVQSLFPQLMGIPGVLAFVINPPSLGGRFSSSPVEYVLEAESYEELQKSGAGRRRDSTRITIVLRTRKATTRQRNGITTKTSVLSER